MKIESSEKRLTGHWIFSGGRLVADKTCQRINDLITTHLREIGKCPGGSELLYRDPDDGRLWELVHPHAYLQDGGPPHLRCLTAQEATGKYGDLAAAVAR